MKTLILLVTFATSASAEQTVQPKAHAAIVFQQIAATGATGVSITCSSDSDNCTLKWTPKPGTPVAFVDKKAQLNVLLLELGGIEDKLDVGTATLADAQRAIKIVIVLTRLTKAP